MMRKLLPNLLFAGFALHILISLMFIVSPTFFAGTRFSRIYKGYLLPGPFFSDDRITTSNNIDLSWKKDGKWSESIYPLKIDFNRYHENFDPTHLYANRYIRSFYHVMLIEPALRGDRKSFSQAEWYLLSKHYPSSADSVQILVTRKHAGDFKIKIDTIMYSH